MAGRTKGAPSRPRHDGRATGARRGKHPKRTGGVRAAKGAKPPAAPKSHRKVDLFGWHSRPSLWWTKARILSSLIQWCGRNNIDTSPPGTGFTLNTLAGSEYRWVRASVLEGAAGAGADLDELKRYWAVIEKSETKSRQLLHDLRASAHQEAAAPPKPAKAKAAEANGAPARHEDIGWKPAPKRRSKGAPAHLSYFQDVAAGRVLACAAIRRLAEKVLLDHRDGAGGKWAFREDLALQVCDFLERMPLYVGERWHGKTIKLMPWQRALVCEMYGWRDPSDHRIRRYTDLHLEVGRKSGKSTIIGGLMLYEGACGPKGGQLLCAAPSEKQAGYVHDAMKKAALRMDGEWTGDPKVWAKPADGVEWVERDTTAQTVASGADTKPGSNPSFICFDEAALLTAKFMEAMKTGTGGRLNFIVINISTAGPEFDGPWMDNRTAFLASLADPDWRLDREFPMYYHLEGETDPDESPENWIKALPGFGVTPLKRNIEDAWNKAKTPAAKRFLLMYHGNLYLGSQSVWMDPGEFGACAGKRPSPEVLAQSAYWQGFDLGVTTAFSSLCHLWELPDGQWWAEWESWLPEASYEAERVNGGPVWDALKDAVEAGELVITKGRTADYEPLIASVKEGHSANQWQGIGVDTAQGQGVIAKLENVHGIEVTQVKQTVAGMKSATSFTGNAILDRTLGHGGNGVVRWCFGNVRVKVKSEPAKIFTPTNREDLRIDPIVALINAMALAHAQEQFDLDSFADQFWGRKAEPGQP